MILVWSSEGGPLQYVGIALFFIQFLLPRFFSGGFNIQIDLDLLFAFSLVTSAVVVGVGTLWLLWEWQGQGAENVANSGDESMPDISTASSASSDSARHDRASDPGGNASTNNFRNDDARLWNDGFFVTRVWNNSMNFFDSISPAHLLLATGFMLPLSMALPLILGEEATEMIANVGPMRIIVLAIAAHAAMAFAAYGVIHDVLAGTGNYPGLLRGQRGGSGRRGRKLSVEEIAEIVRQIPVEEYVSEESIKSECSVGRLKRMLVNRGASNVAAKCVEKDDLINEINKIRKRNEECAICAETYNEGDALRVLQCHHEYHVHCFDRWVYTFSTDSRPASEPTCPLCKCELK